MRHGYGLAGLLAVGWMVGQAGSSGAQGFEDVEIGTQDLGAGLHMLTGRGGNMLASIGPDGAFLVDDQFAPLTAKILAAIERLGGGAPRFVLNTHFHGDHTGGNENLGKAGALIVAHDEVRVRLSSEQVSRLRSGVTPPAPAAALPVVTFSDQLGLHLNGHSIRGLYAGPAHTDGDTIVHFPEANVLHMGDIYFNGLYPFIDVDAGGRIDGMIAGAERGAALADAATRIVPGHGPLSDRDGLLRFRDMLVAVRDAVKQAMAEGRSEDEIVAAAPTAAFDAQWGGGFLSPERFTRLVYASLEAAR